MAHRDRKLAMCEDVYAGFPCTRSHIELLINEGMVYVEQTPLARKTNKETVSKDAVFS
jgi:hypothetical protein